MKNEKKKEGRTNDGKSRKATGVNENNLQGFLVTSPYNLRYLTNFTGTTGLAMITLDKAFCNGFSLYGTSCGTSNWFYYR